MVGVTPLEFILFIAICLAVLLLPKIRRAKREKAEKLSKMEQEAVAFFEQLNRAGFRPVETRLILQKEEFALLEETCVGLQETRSFRVYAGGGTRVGKIYLGGGVSESEQRWKQIDSGTLTLTTNRIVFDGRRENRTIRLPDILSASVRSLDAIEVNSQRRAKAVVFTGLLNPLIWASLIQQLARGEGPSTEPAIGQPPPNDVVPQEAKSGSAQATTSLRRRAISSEEGRSFFSRRAGPSANDDTTASLS